MATTILGKDKQMNTHSRKLAKIPTYIPGLDDILHGGFPQGRMTLITGDPGTGKTLLALQFLIKGALRGEPGIFVGFEESIANIKNNCATLGWDVEHLEKAGSLFMIQGTPDPEAIINGSFSLKGLLAVADGKAKEMGAKRIAFDALEVLFRFYDVPHHVRSEILIFNNWLARTGLSAIMTLKPGGKRKWVGTYEDYFDSQADCLLHLNIKTVNQITTRRLKVIKYRGSGFASNDYPYIIAQDGLHLAPITSVKLAHHPLGKKISSGLSKLDQIVYGGFRQGSCLLFAGLPGTGKTVLASTFSRAACERGERVFYVSFEESQDALLENIKSTGLNLWPYVHDKHLVILATMPESMGAEEHLICVLTKLNSFKPQFLIVDAISACERMGGKQAAFEFLMRLLNTCKDRGITIILINQTAGASQYLEISGNNISSMIDTVIFMDYVKGQGETNRILQVLKARGSAHSNQQWEYRITSRGIEISDLYLGEGEVLTGAARIMQEEKDRAAEENLKARLAAKKAEIDILSSTIAAESAKHQARIAAAELELKRLELAQQQLEKGKMQRSKIRRFGLGDE